MMETPSMTPDPVLTEPAPKKSNTTLIIVVVVVLLLCCCCILGVCGWYLWTNGDSLMNQGTSLLRNIL